ncbi:hypothetical protein BYT27DRAFT_7241127 [Phlegmacium glaucopus]|nr:hypothetical protein BYT27DRAFT_7241127 [Phlegmacium glaucopus]
MSPAPGCLLSLSGPLLCPKVSWNHKVLTWWMHLGQDVITSSYSVTMHHSNEELRKENLVLRTKLETLQNAYEILAQSVQPTAQNSTYLSTNSLGLSFLKSETPLLSPCPSILGLKSLHAREDHPDIKFWTRSDWVASKDIAVSSDHSGTAARGRSRAARGENVSMNFIEDINGQVIDGHKASEIRKAIRELWVEMDQGGVAPPTWSKVPHTVVMNFRQRLYDQFPELAYCDGHWKLDKICTDNYSQWFKTQNSSKISQQSTSAIKRPVTPGPDSLPPSKKPKSGPQLKTIIHGRSSGSQPQAQAHAEANSILQPTKSPQPQPNADILKPVIPLVTIQDLDMNTSRAATPPPSPTMVMATATATALQSVQDVGLQGSESSMQIDNHLSLGLQIPSSSSNPDTIPVPLPIGIHGDGDGNMLVASSPNTGPEFGAHKHAGAEPANINLDPVLPGVHSDEMLMEPQHQECDVAAPVYQEQCPPISMPKLKNPLAGITRSQSASTSIVLGSTWTPPIHPIVSTASIIANAAAPMTTTPAPSINDVPVLPNQIADTSVKQSMVPVKATTRKSGKMRTSKSTTARNLCAIDWLKSNPKGTYEEFANYFDGLPQAELKIYQALEANAKMAKAASRGASTGTTGK